MIRQEVNAKIARLTKIWKEELASPIHPWEEDLDTLVAKVQLQATRVFLYIDEDQLCLRTDLWDYWLIGYYEGLIVGADYDPGTPQYKEQQKFEQIWLSAFRRGCWLSGCPIEASAHEKTEWMRGFTPEEIELWNLNL